VLEQSFDIEPALLAMVARREQFLMSHEDIESGRASKALAEQGVVMIPGLCDPHFCKRLLYNISRLRETYPVRIDEPEHRTDLPLLYGGYATQVFLDALPSVGAVIGNLLGDNPEVAEFSCMISFPGAKRQSPHPDVRHAEGVAEMYSVFIPLSDQDLQMGPLLTWPTTHLEFPEKLKMSEMVPMLGQCGSVVIMNSRLFHCGGQNISEKARPVFYFTLKGPGDLPMGSTLSIAPEFKGMRLNDLLGLNEQAHVVGGET